ncbi:DnaJ domain-containing protein [Nostoc sp.]|uniref:DnaJ domain-containing protein n=1 Tax=Nostoc sp. TaxID=1180 RepID=UPI002FF69AE7
MLTEHLGAVNTVAISLNSQTLISGSTDATIKVWNLQTGELLSTLTGHSAAVLSVAISPDGKTLASASRDGTIKLWNLHTGELLQNLSGCNPVAFSPDGKTLISGGNGGSIKIWSQFTLDSGLSGEWWEVLGVNQSDRPNVVKLAYCRLARLYHPDVNSSVSAKASMQAINQAYKEFKKQII